VFTIIVLGSGGAIPQPGRYPSSIAVRVNGEILLFDTGEGVQRRVLGFGLGIAGLRRVFITHLHGDHVLGLFPFLQTMSMQKRTAPLEVYGPPGLSDLIAGVLRGAAFRLTFPILTIEIYTEGLVFESHRYRLYAKWLKHGVPTLGYKVEERVVTGRFKPEEARRLGVPEGPLWKQLKEGKSVRLPDGRVVRPEQVTEPPPKPLSIAYLVDTAVDEGNLDFVRGVDVLIHDTTFTSDLADRAAAEGHGTARGVAEFAQRAGVRLLVMTHLSSRYKDPLPHLQEAMSVGVNTVYAYDGMVIHLTREGISFTELKKWRRSRQRQEATS